MAESRGLIRDEMSVRIVETAEKLALSQGAGQVTVRSIIRALDVTNRVFYNRFHNVDEVLAIVYQDLAVRMRESIIAKFDPEGDFIGQITDIAAGTLELSYRLKMGMNQYVFTQDSVAPENLRWWRDRIRSFIELGKRRGEVSQDVDADIMSYAIWCFIRGYNADALARELPEEEALRGFRYSFGVLLRGMRG